MVFCLPNQIKLTNAQKRLSFNSWLVLKSGMSTMLSNSGPRLKNEDNSQRQPKQVVLKQAFNYLAEQKLRQTVLLTFENIVKSYLLVQHDTKQERGEK